ncbi:hypothetical protein ETAA8_06660 [Anatilimnocola aggregata]|uniref:Uncharacterized protein n=1 Tax=Anatilimnocola aggregata TaxID=2528021 RepID=A0A517Y5W3_9BACT|nr:hypothetical protein [Anatilimnocola aggregata]QDU25596.1 hypothetical protein ETAA8_06660 [Anatilimnocola aggregata]
MVTNLKTPMPPGDREDFICLANRAIFKAHTNRMGQNVGERELTLITERCNERIEDTGDYVPLIINHTSDDGKSDPEVVGFVGPFAMGRLGTRRPLPAIFGRMWIYREKKHLLKKYPRISVEFWQDASDPGTGFFDPISLLGATTPELDLGLHYEKTKDAANRRLVKYAKVERFSANPDSHERGSTMLSPEDIQQIVAALDGVITQKISEATAGMKGQAAKPKRLEPDDDLDDELEDVDEPEAAGKLDPAMDERLNRIEQYYKQFRSGGPAVKRASGESPDQYSKRTTDEARRRCDAINAKAGPHGGRANFADILAEVRGEQPESRFQLGGRYQKQPEPALAPTASARAATVARDRCLEIQARGRKANYAMELQAARRELGVS